MAVSGPESPSEQHYSLKWNDYSVKLVTAFQSLRDEEDFVDVTVACDGHQYSAHKMVLSACSPYFRAMLRSNPCQHPIVILKDVGHSEMERLLEFMYNGEVNIAQDQLAAFLRTAENLKIRGLAGSSDDMEQIYNREYNSLLSSLGKPATRSQGRQSSKGHNGSNNNTKTSRDDDCPAPKKRKLVQGDHGGSVAATDKGGDADSDEGSRRGVEVDVKCLSREQLKCEPCDPGGGINDELQYPADLDHHQQQLYSMGLGDQSIAGELLPTSDSTDQGEDHRAPDVFLEGEESESCVTARRRSRSVLQLERDDKDRGYTLTTGQEAAPAVENSPSMGNRETVETTKGNSSSNYVLTKEHGKKILKSSDISDISLKDADEHSIKESKKKWSSPRIQLFHEQANLISFGGEIQVSRNESSLITTNEKTTTLSKFKTPPLDEFGNCATSSNLLEHPTTDQQDSPVACTSLDYHLINQQRSSGSALDCAPGLVGETKYQQKDEADELHQNQACLVSHQSITPSSSRSTLEETRSGGNYEAQSLNFSFPLNHDNYELHIDDKSHVFNQPTYNNAIYYKSPLDQVFNSEIKAESAAVPDARSEGINRTFKETDSESEDYLRNLRSSGCEFVDPNVSTGTDDLVMSIIDSDIIYPCESCPKVFRHPRSYCQHQHVHRGTYSCPHCGKLFSRKWDLMRHLKKSKLGCPAISTSNKSPTK